MESTVQTLRSEDTEYAPASLNRRKRESCPTTAQEQPRIAEREYLTPAVMETLLESAASGRCGNRDRTLLLVMYRRSLRVTARRSACAGNSLI